MTNVIDNRIVEIELQNKDFEANAKTSIKTLEQLQAAMDFSNSGKGIDNVSKQLDNLNLDKIASSVETISNKFSMLGAIGFTALNNITNKLVDTGLAISTNLLIGQKNAGFGEYELKMNSIKTIMEGSGEELDTVKDKLNELNEYADKTIYSFSDMTRNIGKFTNAGVDLDKSVAAIKGISNLAAISGQNAESASRAMYNIAQSLSAGYVKLIDWKSIENANMATIEFKQQLLDTALAMGTVVKVGDKYQSTTTDLRGNVSQLFTATSLFNESLAHQWVTTDVMVKTLNDYASEETEIGVRANKAATEVRTFSIMMDALREASGSSWAETWEYIFGDLNEATELWTNLSEKITAVMDAFSKPRNDVLKYWNEFGGRGAVLTGLSNIFNLINSNVSIIGKVWRKVFPRWPVNWLQTISFKFLSWTETLHANSEVTEAIGHIFEFFFRILKLGINTIKLLFKSLTGFNPLFKDMSKGFSIIIIYLGELAKKANKTLAKMDDFTDLGEIISLAIQNIYLGLRKLLSIVLNNSPFSKLLTWFGDLITATPKLNKTSTSITGLSESLDELREAAKNAISIKIADIREFFKQADIKQATVDSLNYISESLITYLESLYNIQKFKAAVERAKEVIKQVIYFLRWVLIAGSLAYAVYKIVPIFYKLTIGFATFRQVLGSLGIMFKSIGTGIKKFFIAKGVAEEIEAIAKLLLLTGIALGILVYAMDRPGGMQKYLIAAATLAAVLAISLVMFFKSMNLLNKVFENNNDFSIEQAKRIHEMNEALENYIKPMITFIAVTSACAYILAQGVKTVAEATNQITNPKAFYFSLVLITGAVAGMIFAANRLVKLGNDVSKAPHAKVLWKIMYSVAAIFTAIGFSIYMISNSISSLMNVMLQNSYKGGSVLIALVTSILVTTGLFIGLFKALEKYIHIIKENKLKDEFNPKTAFSIALTLLAVSSSLNIMMFAVKSLATFMQKMLTGKNAVSPGELVGLMGGALVILGLSVAGVTGLVILLAKASEKLGNAKTDINKIKQLAKIFKTVGASLFTISFALVSLATSIALIDKMGNGADYLLSSFAIMGVTVLALSLATAGIVTVTKNVDAESLKNASSIIQILVSAMRKIVSSIIILTIVSKLTGSTAVYGALTGIIFTVVSLAAMSAVIIKTTQNANANSIKKAVNLVGAMIESLIVIVFSISALAIVSKFLGNANILASALTISVFLYLLTGVIAILTKMPNVNKVVPVLLNLSVLITAISISLSILGSAFSKVNPNAIIGVLSTLIVTFGMLIITLGVMSMIPASSIPSITSMTISLISLMIALSLFTSVMAAVSESLGNNPDIVQGLKILGVALAAFLGVIGILSLIASVPAVQTGMVVLGTTIISIMSGFAVGAIGFSLGVSIFVAAVTTLITLLSAFSASAVQGLANFDIFMQELANRMPSIADSFARSLGTLLTSLLSTTDIVANFLINLLIISPLNKVEEYLPVILTKIATIILSIGEFIITYAPRFADMLLRFLITALDFLSSRIPVVLDRLFMMIITTMISLSEIIRDNAPVLRNAVLEIMHNLIDAILGILGIDRNGTTSKFIHTIFEAIFNSIGIGVKLIEKGLSGITGIVKNVVEGFTKGFEKIKDVKDSIANMGNSVIKTFKNIFQIHSPSRVMAKIGEYIGEGLINGLVSEIDPVSKITDLLGSNMINSLKDRILGSNLGQLASGLVGDLKDSFSVDMLSDMFGLGSILGEEGIFGDFTITPNVDLTNVEGASGDIASILNASTIGINAAGGTTSQFTQNRAAEARKAAAERNMTYDDSSVRAYLATFNNRLQELSQRLGNTQIVLDNGVLVGEMVSPMDTALGSKVNRNEREKG